MPKQQPKVYLNTCRLSTFSLLILLSLFVLQNAKERLDYVMYVRDQSAFHYLLFLDAISPEPHYPIVSP